MARIIIASASTGRQLEVEQTQFDEGFFPGWYYVSDAPLAATTEPTAEETRVAGFVSAGGSGPLPTALRAAYVPLTTKRATLSFGGANSLVGAAAYDICQRAMFILPVAVTRYRFRVGNRNNNTAARTPLTTPITITGIAMGTPAFDGTTGRWTSAFTTAPTSLVSGSVSVPTGGSDYISGWFTSPAISANTPIMYSMGWTSVASGTGLTASSTQGAAASAAGSSGRVLDTTALAVGTGTLCLDVRIEYEFAATARNLVGVYIGDSIVEGEGDGDTTASPQAATLPHESWPGAYALRTGSVWINGGIGGSSAGGYWCQNGGTVSALGRFDLATTVPDFAVIGAGSNDIVSSVTLASYQSYIATIVGALRSLSIQRIYLTTILPRNFGATPEAIRASCNAWLRSVPLGVAGVFDMDKALRNPATPAVCEADAISTDNTHPLRAGYIRMAQAATAL